MLSGHPTSTLPPTLDIVSITAHGQPIQYSGGLVGGLVLSRPSVAIYRLKAFVHVIDPPQGRFRALRSTPLDVMPYCIKAI